jgi:hypothetical protein
MITPWHLARNRVLVTPVTDMKTIFKENKTRHFIAQ